jgi:predicted DNA-binding transcriptional regulator AlpA
MSKLDIDRLPLRDWGEAATYCGLNHKYFVNLVKEGRGPVYVKPSQRTVLFRQQDLDAWMASWLVVVPRAGTNDELAQARE